MKRLWACCVTVTFKPRGRKSDGGWRACLKWTWGEFGHPECMEGLIHNRYPTGLRRALDQVMELADQFGIVTPDAAFCIYAEDEDDPGLPPGWMDRLRREAERRDWESYPVEEDA